MWWEHRDYVWYVRHGKKIFFCRTHFFSYPTPLGGVTPEKKISHLVSKFFFFPPPWLFGCDFSLGSCNSLCSMTKLQLSGTWVQEFEDWAGLIGLSLQPAFAPYLQMVSDSLL